MWSDIESNTNGTEPTREDKKRKKEIHPSSPIHLVYVNKTSKGARE